MGVQGRAMRDVWVQGRAKGHVRVQFHVYSGIAALQCPNGKNGTTLPTLSLPRWVHPSSIGPPLFIYWCTSPIGTDISSFFYWYWLHLHLSPPARYAQSKESHGTEQGATQMQLRALVLMNHSASTLP